MRRLTPQALKGEIRRPIEVAVEDLPRLHGDAVGACIRRTLCKCGVIRFRLSEISPDILLDVASVIGEPSEQRVYGAHAEQVTRDTLHLLADPIWQQSPPDIALLAAGAGAAGQGGLISASRTMAYEALSPAMKRYLDGMEACHDASQPLASACETPDQLRWLATLRERHPPQRHALSFALAENGKKALGVSPAFTAAIQGVPQEEGRAVLSHLKALFEEPESQCRIEWEEGLVVIWNPRATLLYPYGEEDVPFPVSYVALKRRDMVT